MISKNRYENILLKEVQGLSEKELFKIVKIIHFLKEILEEKRGNVTDVLKFAGIWKDMPQNKAAKIENWLQ